MSKSKLKNAAARFLADQFEGAQRKPENPMESGNGSSGHVPPPEKGFSCLEKGK